MKAFTDLEQSKKLAEILPLESADMSWNKEFDSGMWLINLVKYTSWIVPRYSYNKIEDRILPCWSLTALLNIIPKRIKDFNVLRMDMDEKDFSIWYDEIGYGVNTELPDITMGFSVDACYEMIIKLHELKML